MELERQKSEEESVCPPWGLVRDGERKRKLETETGDCQEASHVSHLFMP